jgi:hypothetical protein
MVTKKAWGSTPSFLSYCTARSDPTKSKALADIPGPLVQITKDRTELACAV